MSVWSLQGWFLETFFARLQESQTAKDDADREKEAAFAEPWPRFEVTNDFRGDVRSDEFERGRPVRARAWDEVTGFCLHQTANKNLHPGHGRLKAIPAHALVHLDGSVSLLHFATEYMQHGNGLNRSTIGIEFVCRAAGVDKAPRTFWRSRKEKANGRRYEDLVREATPEQLEAGVELMKWYRALKRYHNGGDIPHIWAHRQSHRSRASDPGERIWRGVALEAERHGIAKTVPDRVVGSGKRIPEIWGGAKGVKYR